MKFELKLVWTMTYDVVKARSYLSLISRSWRASNMKRDVKLSWIFTGKIGSKERLTQSSISRGWTSKRSRFIAQSLGLRQAVTSTETGRRGAAEVVQLAGEAGHHVNRRQKRHIPLRDLTPHFAYLFTLNAFLLIIFTVAYTYLTFMKYLRPLHELFWWYGRVSYPYVASVPKIVIQMLTAPKVHMATSAVMVPFAQRQNYVNIFWRAPLYIW